MPDVKGELRAADGRGPDSRTPDPRAPEFRAADSRTGDARAAGPAGANLLFLREEELRSAQDLLFFAYRDFTRAADEVLEGMGMGRAHHRALHYIGRNPSISVSDLLSILRITKQSLARVLNALVEEGFVTQQQGQVDRRQRLLALTDKGQALERQLFERQRERLAGAYREAGAGAVEGFRRVMRGIMDADARSYLDRERGGR
jgi:DNA-binding MarR family transcriptional regulator